MGGLHSGKQSAPGLARVDAALPLPAAPTIVQLAAARLASCLPGVVDCLSLGKQLSILAGKQGEGTD